MKVLKKKKTNSKNDNAKKTTLRSTKSSQSVDAKQPKAPSKDVAMAAFIMPENYS